MKQQLWLFGNRNQWWTNGHYTITDYVVQTANHSWIQKIYFDDSGYVLCKDAFNYPDLSFLKKDWTPLSPEEVARILDET